MWNNVGLTIICINSICFFSENTDWWWWLWTYLLALSNQISCSFHQRTDDNPNHFFLCSVCSLLIFHLQPTASSSSSCSTTNINRIFFMFFLVVKKKNFFDVFDVVANLSCFMNERESFFIFFISYFVWNWMGWTI